MAKNTLRYQTINQIRSNPKYPCERVLRALVHNGKCPGFYQGNRFYVDTERLDEMLGDELIRDLIKTAATPRDTQLYCVYEHLFPNGKRYIGISCDPERRWDEGCGYATQPKVYKAIKKYGWDNIKHTIIVDGLPRDDALRLESYLILTLHTVREGYNARS